jgi:hypothetical protein
MHTFFTSVTGKSKELLRKLQEILTSIAREKSIQAIRKTKQDMIIR